MVTLQHYLFLSAALFTLGVIGVMFRRNLIVILMSLELMLNAVNLSFVAFARYLDSPEGQVFVLFIMVVAAAEVAVGLALAVAIFRQRGTVDVNDVNLMKW
jgi:NADH-quinone oxidoreductase subunit K